MSINNICFHKENQKKCRINIKSSLNTPSFSSLLIFLVSLSLLGRYFSTHFTSNFKKTLAHGAVIRLDTISFLVEK